MLQDIAREKQNRNIQQTSLYQIQQIDNSPRAAVAILKGMNSLKLIMQHRHFDQRVQAIIGVQKFLQICQLVANHRFAYWRGINHFALCVLERRSRRAAHIKIQPFDHAHNIHK